MHTNIHNIVSQKKDMTMPKLFSNIFIYCRFVKIETVLRDNIANSSVVLIYFVTTSYSSIAFAF